ncbi:hypothetical protein VIGAN_02191900, partial [Vigna angularis var. angularis]
FCVLYLKLMLYSKLLKLTTKKKNTCFNMLNLIPTHKQESMKQLYMVTFYPSYTMLYPKLNPLTFSLEHFNLISSTTLVEL